MRRAVVRSDTGGHVDGDDEGPGSGRPSCRQPRGAFPRAFEAFDERRKRPAQPAAGSDSQNSVDPYVGAGRFPGDGVEVGDVEHSAACGAGGGKARLVRALGDDRGDAHAPPGEERSGEKGVSPVVPGSDQGERPPAVGSAEEPQDRQCKGTRSPLHEGNARGQERRFGLADLPGAECPDHSTVTDFARLRGLSTSYPLTEASSQAKICSGTTVTSGIMRVGVDRGTQKTRVA